MTDDPASPRDAATTPPSVRVEVDAAATRMTIPPWVQMVGLPVVAVFTYLFAQAASHAILVFLIAALISLLLAPVVRSLAASGIPRLLSVLLVFGLFAAIVTALLIAAVNFAADQAADIRSNANSIGESSLQHLDDVQGFIDDRGWNIDLRDQGERFVGQLEERSTELSRSALDVGRELVTFIAEAAFNLILVIVITIYMLLDAPRIGRFFSSVLPASSGIDQLHGRIQRSLLRYAIGQTLASIVMGASASLALFIFGKTGVWDAGDQYAILFGVIVAITEFAPSIGPVLGAIPVIITASFDGIGPALAVTILFLLLHQIEGHIVIPKLMGAAIAVHPLLVIFGVLAGAQMLGIGGLLLALPLLAVGREIVMFIRERVKFGAFTPAIDVAGLPGGTSVSERASDALEGNSVRFGDGHRRAAVRARLRGLLPNRMPLSRSHESVDGPAASDDEPSHD
ncbi:MAG: family transporter [Thermoleophilia bacterium]|nr:family transporter [Thermoleophilia bacterium]